MGEDYMMMFLNSISSEKNRHFAFTEEMTDRFKGLDLIDNVPEKLWMEVCTGGSDKNHPQEKEIQNSRLQRHYK